MEWSSLTELDLWGVQHFWPFKRNQLFVGSGFVLDALLGTLWFVIYSFLLKDLSPTCWSCLFAWCWDIKVTFCYKVFCSFACYIILTHANWCHLSELFYSLNDPQILTIFLALIVFESCFIAFLNVFSNTTYLKMYHSENGKHSSVERLICNLFFARELSR